MSSIEQAPTNYNFEQIEEVKDTVSQGIQNWSLTDAMPLARNQSFSLSHKYPELQAVLNQTEIQTARNDASELSLEQSITEASDSLVRYLADKYGGLPREVLLAAMDIPANKQSHFMLENKLKAVLV